MMYCNACGQCIHISDDQFIAYRNITGWESRYINPETGETEDYGDYEVTDSEEDYMECSHCNSTDIDFAEDVDAEEAFNQRAEFEKEMKTLRKVREKQQVNARTKDAEWDCSVNPI